MKGLLLLAIVALAFMSFTAVIAENTNISVDGYNWATRICSSAHGLCKNSHELGYAAVGCGLLWLLMLIMK